MHLAVGTPMFGGNCFGEYTQSLLDLNHYFSTTKNNLLTTIFVRNQSLITLARNSIVHTFLNKTDAEYLIFIDADISFRAEDIIRMISYDKDMVLGIYPMKYIDWNRVKLNKDKKNLEDYYQVYPINILNKVHEHDIFKIKWGGCGFMLIKREVFTKLKKHVTTFKHNNEVLYNFFDTGIEEKTNIHLPEDFNFCQKFNKIGGKIYADPKCTLSHFGNFEFKNSVML
jgi:hypothetical protein